MVFDCDVLGAPGVGRRMGGPRGMLFIFSVPTAISLYPSTIFLVHPVRLRGRTAGDKARGAGQNSRRGRGKRI